MRSKRVKSNSLLKAALLVGGVLLTGVVVWRFVLARPAEQEASKKMAARREPSKKTAAKREPLKKTAAKREPSKKTAAKRELLKKTRAHEQAERPVEGPIEAFRGEAKFEMQKLFDGERFPNMAVAIDGTVLASWGDAARNFGLGDVGLRVRRSEDGGKTWGKLITIANPCWHGGG